MFAWRTLILLVLSCRGSTISFMLQADGTGGNRVFDGLSESHVDGTFGINDPTDPTASFRNGDSSMLTCPGNNEVALDPFVFSASYKGP